MDVLNHVPERVPKRDRQAYKRQLHKNDAELIEEMQRTGTCKRLDAREFDKVRDVLSVSLHDADQESGGGFVRGDRVQTIDGSGIVDGVLENGRFIRVGGRIYANSKVVKRG